MKHQKSKQILLGFVLVVTGIVVGLFLSNGDTENHSENDGHNHRDTTAKETLWTCSMHPQIKLREPGLCPICAMDLIPLEEGMAADGPFAVTLSEASATRAQIETTPVKKRALEKQLRFYGVVEVNEEKRALISARYAGRIEKLFVNFTGATVKKGAPLLSIYSPELITLQQELLTNQRIAQSGRDFDVRVFEASKRKLRLLGFSQGELKKILSSQTPMDHLIIRATASGTVLRLTVREGAYIKEGAPLLEIANLTSLWLQAEVYERDLPFVSVGDTISFQTELNPSEVIYGTVSFIDPLIDRQKRTAQVRIELDEHSLKPGAYGEVSLVKMSEPLLTIPNSAPLYTGKRAVVYVAKKESGKVTYEGREIGLGKRGTTFTEVISGLAEGDEVVSRGAFRIDGELQIMAKTSVMELMNSEVQMESHPLPPALLAFYDTLISNYLSFEEALAADDEERAKAQLAHTTALLRREPSFSGKGYSIWHSELGGLKNEVQSGSFNTILELRSFLLLYSNALIALQNEYGFQGDNLFLAHCPMAFDNNGGHWIQKSENLRNPYYGASMLKCGAIQRSFGK